MTDATHPITPPPDLVQQWLSEPEYGTPGRVTLHTISEQRLFQLLTRSSQWGADTKLDACCEWLEDHAAVYVYEDYYGPCFNYDGLLDDLKEAMRPTTTQENNQ
jgi:hypothetical protein